MEDRLKIFCKVIVALYVYLTASILFFGGLFLMLVSLIGYIIRGIQLSDLYMYTTGVCTLFIGLIFFYGVSEEQVIEVEVDKEYDSLSSLVDTALNQKVDPAYWQKIGDRAIQLKVLSTVKELSG